MGFPSLLEVLAGDCRELFASELNLILVCGLYIFFGNGKGGGRKIGGVEGWMKGGEEEWRWGNLLTENGCEDVRV